MMDPHTRTENIGRSKWPWPCVDPGRKAEKVLKSFDKGQQLSRNRISSHHAIFCCDGSGR